jgi:hypothetical protein
MDDGGTVTCSVNMSFKIEPTINITVMLFKL